MVHEVRGAHLVVVDVEADQLHACDVAVLEVAEVEGRIAPVGEEPVLHEAMALIADEVRGLAVDVVGIKGVMPAAFMSAFLRERVI